MSETSPSKKHKEMDPELFDSLDNELRELFDRCVTRDKKYGNSSTDFSHGQAAAQAAQALIDLHYKFSN